MHQFAPDQPQPSTSGDVVPFRPRAREPFVMLPAHVLTNTRLTPWARLVYAALVMHDNRERGCFPSRKTIAAELGTNLSAVARALTELEREGLITRQRTEPGGVNRYTLPRVKYDPTPVSDSHLPRAKYDTRVVANMTHKRDEENKTKEPPVPFPAANDYAATLNGKMGGVVKAFQKLSPELNGGWLAGAFAKANAEGAPPVTESQLLDRLGAARRVIEKQVVKERKGTAGWAPDDRYAWARSKVVLALKGVDVEDRQATLRTQGGAPEATTFRAPRVH